MVPAREPLAAGRIKARYRISVERDPAQGLWTPEEIKAAWGKISG